ncbi:MAG: dihydrodipicolinate synthase family protein [Clostridia bacterium]|nr:dihydrodipicolinate synthase family protein [Clostridia bacterium]
MKQLKGVVCATVTPMMPDGSVDYAGVRSLCRHLNANGIHCLYPNGTNGESLSLSAEERQKIASAILAENQNRATVYIQCGASTVSESYAHVRHARALGADGAGLMTPVFFPMDEKAMQEYYETILDEITDFPLYVYNIFTRTGNDVSAELLGRLMDRYSNLYGIKFSYPDLERIKAYVNAPQNRRAHALIGSDCNAMNCYNVGGCGWVSGPAAVYCKLHTGLWDALEAGNKEGAVAMQKGIETAMANIAGIPEIPAIKYMLMKMGVIAYDTCRAPFRKLTDEEKQRLDVALEAYQKMI